MVYLDPRIIRLETIFEQVSLVLPVVNMFTFIQSKNLSIISTKLAVCSTAAPPTRQRAAATEELSTYKGVYNTGKQIRQCL